MAAMWASWTLPHPALPYPFPPRTAWPCPAFNLIHFMRVDYFCIGGGYAGQLDPVHLGVWLMSSLQLGSKDCPQVRSFSSCLSPACTKSACSQGCDDSQLASPSFARHLPVTWSNLACVFCRGTPSARSPSRSLRRPRRAPSRLPAS